MNSYDEDNFINSQTIAGALFCFSLEITFAAMGYFLWFLMVEGRV
jgi:hypothetical protein